MRPSSAMGGPRLRPPMTKRDDVADLKRVTAIWVAAVAWVAVGYILQEPAKDPYDSAERTAFTYAILIVIPGISALFAAAWIIALRRQRRDRP